MEKIKTPKANQENTEKKKCHIGEEERVWLDKNKLEVDQGWKC